MSDNKIIGLICGGCSLEHEVSLQSAVFAAQSILASGYSLQLFFITQEGSWIRIHNVADWIIHQPKQIAAYLSDDNETITPVFGENDRQWQSLHNPKVYGRLDVIVPIMHGQGAEDGAIQGVCHYWHLPFVGPNIQDAVITFNKSLTKALLQRNDIPVVPWIDVQSKAQQSIQLTCTQAIQKIPTDWQYPLFIKVNCGGSSLGVEKVHTPDALLKAMLQLFEIASHLIIEPAIQGQEIECPILIGETIEAAGLGELMVHADFYSYQAKYTDDKACVLSLKANLSDDLVQIIRETAKRVGAILGCQSMARVDFFVTPSGDFYVNEVNSIPGFTKISLFPQLWEIAGLAGPALMKQMIQQAINDFNHQQSLAHQGLEYAQTQVPS